MAQSKVDASLRATNSICRKLAVVQGNEVIALRQRFFTSTIPRSTRLAHKHLCSATLQETRQSPHPAVLPGTVQDFPIPAEKLIELAKKYASSSTKPIGVEDESILAPEFRFEFPIVKLGKEEYLKAVKTFTLGEGLPDIQSNAYDFRVDKFEPQRVWFTVRGTGTHTGTLNVFKYKYKATGRKYLGAPECQSLVFNKEGKVLSFTGGYVMDNRLGTTNKLGALFGILQSIGIFVPHPQAGTLGWKVGSAVDTGVSALKSALHFITFGIFKSKPKTE